MLTEQKIIGNGQIELTIEISTTGMEKFLIQAAQKIAEQTKIPGFRPGKAPYDLVKEKVGEIKIYEQALEKAIPQTYWEIVREKNLAVIGQPEIQLTKLAPGNPVVYQATVALLPAVKLGDFRHLSKIKIRPVKTSDQEVNELLTELQKGRGQEQLVSRLAKPGDKVLIDFQMFLAQAPLENGQHKNYPVIIGEHRVIPGLEEKLIGAVKGENKNFSLNFSSDYFDKTIAGKEIDFQVAVQAVYEIILPNLDDEFAKRLGNFNTMAELKKQLAANLQTEKQIKEEQRFEGELLNTLLAQSEFEPIPEILITSECQKMLQEFETMITQNGLPFTDYLISIKKSRDDLLNDFRQSAQERVKTALLLRALAQQEKIQTTDQEIDAEIARLAKTYQSQPEILEQIKQESYREYLKNVLTSRKAIEFLKKTADKD